MMLINLSKKRIINLIVKCIEKESLDSFFYYYVIIDGSSKHKLKLKRRRNNEKIHN